MASGLGSVVPLDNLKRLEVVLLVPSTPRLFKVELARKEWALKVVLVLVAVTVLLTVMLAQPAKVRTSRLRVNVFMGDGWCSGGFGVPGQKKTPAHSG